MTRKAGMVHVVCDNAGFFGQLTAEIMPGVDVVHLVDGGLPSMSADALRPRVIERLRTLASFAEESGAEAILLTCTAFGRLVDEVKGAVSCPVLSVLEIMVEEALKLPGTIGILSSHPGTLATASRMLREQAAAEGRTIELKTQLCPGAFEAMRRGDWATHNQIVLSNLRELVRQVDVVLAPQPSIERAVREFAGSGRNVTVLTSPRLCALRLKEALYAAS